ncbi:MAG TPA: hypothetical protein VIP11_04595 [Gemmatimonadaceae bacterium]
MSVKVFRAISVTLRLAVLGAALGTVAAVLSVILLVAIRIGSGAIADASVILPWIALCGAGAGAVAFPSAAWLLLRRVTLGLALALAGAGIIAGALIGEWLQPFNPYARELPGFIRGAIVGFGLSTLLLRISADRVRRAVHLTDL